MYLSDEPNPCKRCCFHTLRSFHPSAHPTSLSSFFYFSHFKSVITYIPSAIAILRTLSLILILYLGFSPSNLLGRSGFVSLYVHMAFFFSFDALLLSHPTVLSFASGPLLSSALAFSL